VIVGKTSVRIVKIECLYAMEGKTLVAITSHAASRQRECLIQSHRSPDPTSIQYFAFVIKRPFHVTVEEATFGPVSSGLLLRTMVELVERALRSQEVLGSIPDVGRRGFCTF